MLRVYFDVGIAILAERWRSSPPSGGGGGGGKEEEEGWRNNESISRLEKRSGGNLQEVEDDMVLPIGRVNYATLIRPLEPVSSEWRARRGGGGGGDGEGAGSGYLDLDERKVREVEGRWSWNGWEGVPSR